MAEREDKKRQEVYMDRPPKPISEMTEAERRDYARAIVAAFRQKMGRSPS